MILDIAVVTSLLLTLLVATTVVARSGLRGAASLIFAGCAMGMIIGPLELALNLRGNSVFEVIQPLWLQFGLIGLARALVYSLGVAVGITLALSAFGKTRRRADLWNVAAGIGIGLGMSSTAVALFDSQAGWPPFILLTALANMPFQLCFSVIISAALVKSRFDQGANGLLPIAIYTIATGLQAAYQAISLATLSVGHWLAWMQPTMMGMIWLSMIGLFWLTGMAFMVSHGVNVTPAANSSSPENARTHLLMRPALWKILALVVIAPTLFVFLMTWWWSLDTPLGRVMIYTLLATPLLAGSILLRTALALEDKPFKFRWR